MANINIGLNDSDAINALQAASVQLYNWGTPHAGSKIAVTDTNGYLTASNYDSSLLAFLSGMTGDAIQIQLDSKASTNSPTFTGTVSGITATMVGLGNVTNESKATMFTNPTFTGTVTIPEVPVNDTDAASKAYVDIGHAIYFSQVTDITVANTTDETTLFDGTGTIPAGTLRIGDIICIEAYGKMSTYTTNQQAQVRLKFDGTDILGSSSLVVNSGALSDDLFVNRFIVKVKTIGATGTLQCIGYTFIHPGSGITTPNMREINGTDKTIDTTQDITIDETYQWATANAGNTITMSTVLIRKMN